LDCNSTAKSYTRLCTLCGLLRGAFFHFLFTINLTIGVILVVIKYGGTIPGVEVVDGCRGEEELASVEDVVQIECPGGEHLEGADVPAAEAHIVHEVRGEEHGLLLWDQSPPLQSGHEVPGLGPPSKRIVELLHDEGVLRRGGADERGGNGETLLLAVDLDGPVTGLGAEHDATPGTQRGALRPAPRLPGLLLLVGLPPSTADLTAGERGGRAAARVLAVGNDGAVHDGARRGGRRGLEVEDHLPHLVSGEGEHGQGRRLGPQRAEDRGRRLPPAHGMRQGGGQG
jgi:hypothetical protein